MMHSLARNLTCDAILMLYEPESESALLLGASGDLWTGVFPAQTGNRSTLCRDKRRYRLEQLRQGAPKFLPDPSCSWKLLVRKSSDKELNSTLRTKIPVIGLTTYIVN